MNRFCRIAAACIMCSIIALSSAFTASASETSSADASTTSSNTTAATTTTTTKAPTISFSKMYIIGSNGKYYNPTPNYSDSTNKYSYTVPDWMEKAQICFKAKKGMTVTCGDTTGSYSSSLGAYQVEVELSGKSKEFEISFKSSDITRTFTITVYRKQIDTYFQKVVVKDGDSTLEAEGSIDSGLTYIVEDDVDELTVVFTPRHENEVRLQKTGGVSELLELKNNCYTTTMDLELGTNEFVATSVAGDVTATVNITVIRGSAASSSSEAPVSSSEPVYITPSEIIADISSEDPYPSDYFYSSEESDGGFFSSDTNPILWILLGVVIAVVIGACIFMIANMGAKRDTRPMSVPRNSRGRSRDLRYYVDDYDDGYDDYDDDSYYDGYERGDSRRQPPRRQSRPPARRNSQDLYYDDYDDYDGYDDY